MKALKKTTKVVQKDRKYGLFVCNFFKSFTEIYSLKSFCTAKETTK